MRSLFSGRPAAFSRTSYRSFSSEVFEFIREIGGNVVLFELHHLALALVNKVGGWLSLSSLLI